MLERLLNKTTPKCEICDTKIDRQHYRICFWCHMTLPFTGASSDEFMEKYDEAIDYEVEQRRKNNGVAA